LNQYLGRHYDGRMRRTAQRPLPASRIAQGALSGFGILLAFAGTAYLAMAVNLLPSLLAILRLLTYLFAYTPLKRKTPICALVGAVPGAMPPLIGLASANLGLVMLSLARSALAGLVGRTGAFLLSLGLAYCGAQLGLLRSTVAAGRLLLASIVYLPLVFILMAADKG
jgi:heme O synthase-like polyprenyltransferase